MTDTAEFCARLAAQSGRLAFDVGANIGQAALVLAARFARVVSFEPALETVVELDRTRPDNVTIVPAAVSHADGLVALDETADGIRHGMLTSGEHPRWGAWLARRVVPAVTVDTAVVWFGPPDVVKVDTEGHELAVLDGAPRLIADRSAVWLVEVHYPLEDRVRKVFDGYRLTVYPHQPDHFYMEASP